MAVPFTSAASAGLTFSGLAKSEDAPPPLIATATLPANAPHGCAAPNRPQPNESSIQVLRCCTTSGGTLPSSSPDTHSPSLGATKVAVLASMRAPTAQSL